MSVLWAVLWTVLGCVIANVVIDNLALGIARWRLRRGR